jgi:hypothetical protein
MPTSPRPVSPFALVHRRSRHHGQGDQLRSTIFVSTHHPRPGKENGSRWIFEQGLNWVTPSRKSSVQPAPYRGSGVGLTAIPLRS